MRKILAILLFFALQPQSFAEDRRKEAERFFRSAERAYKAAQYEAACEAFERAYQVLPLPAIAFSMAQAYRLQYARDEDPKKLRRAVELYRIYLKAEPNGGRAADASASLADLLPAFSRLSGGGSGFEASRDTKIMVSSPVEEAVGSIDNGPLKKLPFVEVVKEGSHRVHVEAAGYFPINQDYPVVTGQFRAVEAELKPKPVLLDIEARSGSEIQIDGRTIGTSPSAPLEVSAGPHILSVTSRGHEAWSRSIDPKRGETLKLSADQPMTTQRVISYAALGTAGALLLGSGAFALSASKFNKDADALEQKRQTEGLSSLELATFEDTVKKRDDRLRITWITLGAGLGVAAGGAALFFLDHPRADRLSETAPKTARRLKAIPTLSTTGAGVALLGRF